MAVKANELMIGDFIRFKESKNIVVVEAIDYDGNVSNNHVVDFFFCEGFCSGEKRYNYAPDCFEPIPLTPEILVKNGFKKLDFSHYHINNRALVLDADGKWEGPLSWHWVVTEMSTNAKGQPVVLDYYVATINYVHELQHALRLCGIEKEIVL